MGTSAGAQAPYQPTGGAGAPQAAGGATGGANGGAGGPQWKSGGADFNPMFPNVTSNQKSAGAAPDYQGAANQQEQSSQQNVNAQTQQNRPDVSTPFASQQWTVGPDGTPQLSSGLSGGLATGAAALGNQFGQANASPLDPSLFGPVQNGTQAQNQAISSAYNQATSRLNPQFQQAQTSLQSQLASQGLDPNSEAYRNAEQNFGQQQNDAYTSAMNSAVGQGTSAGQAVFGENLQAQQQAISAALAQRNAPLQSLQGLQGLTATPQFNQAGVADPTQYLNAAQATGNYNLQNTNQQNQVLGDAFGAAGGLASGAAGFAKLSDERAKTDIQRSTVEAIPGVPFARWKWKPGFEHEGACIGVIAQDLFKVAPKYVTTGPDGLLRVDYRFLSQVPR